MKLFLPLHRVDRPHEALDISPHTLKANQTTVVAPRLPDGATIGGIFIFPGPNDLHTANGRSAGVQASLSEVF